MSENKNQTQSRFLLAVTLSLGVFLAWTYFFPPPKKPAANVNANTSLTENSNVATSTTAVPTAATPLAPTIPDNTPNKTIIVSTPYYEVKINSQGALATNWVLKKSLSSQGEKELFSTTSDPHNKQPLELISDEARTNRRLPFRLVTDDPNLNSFLNDRNYTVAGAETIELSADQSQKVEFTLLDEANGVEAVKTFTFYGTGYISDFQTKLTRNGQPLANPKLVIGASIGDQGLNHYSTYSIEPEAVASLIGGTEGWFSISALFRGNAPAVVVERHRPLSFDKTEAKIPAVGEVNWAGIGDTYFAMAAIPAAPLAGIEYQTSKYEYQVHEPFYSGIFALLTLTKTEKETRHLTDVFIPIQATGETTKIYVGTKDHFALQETSANLSKDLNRQVDLEDFIYFSWLGFFVRPLAIPILWCINFLNALTLNYGFAIIIFTVIFYSILFPLRWYQSKSFKKAAKNAPKMKELQERQQEMQKKGISAEDPRMRELQMEMLSMTRQSIPLGGCLPLLLQMPLLMSVYTAIAISLDFRQASFLWLPDLATGDPFHILEFLFAASMWAQMAFTPTAPAMTPETQMQQKMMTYMMPGMMLFMMWGAASGLLVYWFTGNIIGFGQQMLINRLNKSSEARFEALTKQTPPTMTKKEMKKTKPNPAS